MACSRIVSPGAALVLALLVAPAIAAERRYTVRVHILALNGSYSQETLAATGEGVSLAECELRRAAWMKETGDDLAALMAQQSKSGQAAGLSVKCEPIK